jgi:hypothetical protein
MILIKIIDGSANESDKLNQFIKENNITNVMSVTVTHQTDYYDTGYICNQWFQTIMVCEKGG